MFLGNNRNFQKENSKGTLYFVAIIHNPKKSIQSQKQVLFRYVFRIIYLVVLSQVDHG